MDTAKDIREFLTSRRAKITPADAGLPVYGTNRRVKGLRREEVAMLAGISVEYYTRLERGNGVSEDVLEGVAKALQLDEAERAHLFDLVRAASTSRPLCRRPGQERVRSSVQPILDSMSDIAAYVRNARLIGELATRSDEFRVRWAAHNGKFHRTATKRFHHPVVGDLTLTYEALDLPADSGQRMLVYTAEPGSPSHDATQLVAGWATTPAAATATGGDDDR